MRIALYARSHRRGTFAVLCAFLATSVLGLACTAQRAQAKGQGVGALFSKYVYRGQRNLSAVLALFVFGFVIAAQAQDLPLPRFASLKADEVNMRAGPGQSYPVEWVFTRKGLPVEIVAEYDQWRKIQDIDGTVGWVHRVMLSGQGGWSGSRV